MDLYPGKPALFILIQATQELRPDYRRFLKAPQAPKNYKDQAKISAYIAEKVDGLSDALASGSTAMVTFSDIRVKVLAEKSKSAEPMSGSRQPVYVVSYSNNPTVVSSQALSKCNVHRFKDGDTSLADVIRDKVEYGCVVHYMKPLDFFVSKTDQELLLCDRLFPDFNFETLDGIEEALKRIYELEPAGEFYLPDVVPSFNNAEAVWVEP